MHHIASRPGQGPQARGTVHSPQNLCAPELAGFLLWIAPPYPRSDSPPTPSSDGPHTQLRWPPTLFSDGTPHFSSDGPPTLFSDGPPHPAQSCFLTCCRLNVLMPSHDPPWWAFRTCQLSLLTNSSYHQYNSFALTSYHGKELDLRKIKAKAKFPCSAEVRFFPQG